ncbi:unnamed protein product [Cochlearia groenlandica]
MCSNQTKKAHRLFVFGDSYADTGNLEQSGESWKPPYGITFPRKPSGRFSDGLTSTDFLVKMLGVKPPNLWRTHHKKKNALKQGINLAFGESGLFKDPAAPIPELTEQIFLFSDLLPVEFNSMEKITPNDISFISYVGKEYLDFMKHNRPVSEIKPLVDNVTESLDTRMILLGGYQFKKIAITNVPPMGCLPYFSSTSSSPSRCNETYSEIVKLHNDSLRKVVAELNANSVRKKKGIHYFIIDYHKAFMTILHDKTKFKNPLKTCCEGRCGLAHSNGTKMYSLCGAPKSSFFWDSVHPSQEGWRSIFSVLGNPFTKA